MPTLKYVGGSHFRSITAADFQKVGLEDAEGFDLARSDVSVLRNPKNLSDTVQVSDEVAAYLMKNEKKDWKKVADETQPELPVGDANDASLEEAAQGSAGKGARARK